MITNALLIRTAYGWDEATRSSSIATHGRHEALYGLGAYGSPADVQTVASSRLDIIAEPRYQYEIEHAPPVATDWAYGAYGVGDRLPVTNLGGSPVSERLLSIAVSEDENTGAAIVNDSLHDIVMYASPVENFVAMQAQAIKKMIAGTGRGDWKEAQPVTPPSIPAPTVAWIPGGVPGWANIAAPPSPFETGCPNYAVGLDDGTILVGEGSGVGVGNSTDPFWIYNPATDSYAATANGPTNSDYGGLHAGAFLASHAYAVASGKGIVRFDAGVWTTRALRASGNVDATACTDGTYLYVLGGSRFERYDPAGNSWTTLAYPPAPFAADDAIVASGGFIYAFGNAVTGSTAKYNIGSNTWDSGHVLAPMPTRRSSCAVGLIDGKVYVAGGYSTPPLTPSAKLEIYDLATDSWSAGPDLDQPTSCNNGAVAGGKLYVFGSQSVSPFGAFARVYTP